MGPLLWSLWPLLLTRQAGLPPSHRSTLPTSFPKRFHAFFLISSSFLFFLLSWRRVCVSVCLVFLHHLSHRPTQQNYRDSSTEQQARPGGEEGSLGCVHRLQAPPVEQRLAAELSPGSTEQSGSWRDRLPVRTVAGRAAPCAVSVQWALCVHRQCSGWSN